MVSALAPLWMASVVASVLLVGSFFAPSAESFIPVPLSYSAYSKTTLRGSFLDSFSELLAKSVSKVTPPKVQVPEDFVPPEPNPLTITSSADIPLFIKSTLAFALRLGTGAFTLGWKIDSFLYNDDENPNKYSLRLGPICIRDSSSVLDQAPCPKLPLVLYEYDASPFCKRVRETINLLDLTVEYRPCPGARQGQFSKQLETETGRRTVPYLFDPNTNTGLFESGDQIEYLLQNYGPPEDTYDRKALWPITFEPYSIYTSTQAAILLDMPGGRRQPNARPDNESMQPLELWGYEASPFVRPVRQKLGSLCLPHIMVSCSRGSANRDRLVQRTGRQFQVPFLVDPNTGVEMFEGPEICKYLEAVYTIQS
jgi:glutathione S-transferase